MSKMLFENLLIPKDGLIKGPFGGDIKKSLFVPKSDEAYKVYEQGVVLKKDIDYGVKDWDNNVPTEEYWRELFRVSKNQIVWGGNYFALPECRCFIVWDKVRAVENYSNLKSRVPAPLRTSYPKFVDDAGI